MKRKIGYIRARYPEIRTIINRGGSENAYIQIGKLRNYYLLFTRACEILSGRFLRRGVNMNNDRHAIYRPIFSPKVDVIHTFNTVCDTDVPWVSTFETCIPRTNRTNGRDWEYGKVTPDAVTKKGYELLTRDNCLALIALSEANKNIQIRMMEALDIENRDKIQEKVVVVHPPQPVLITPEEMRVKFDGVHDCVEFILVGGLFFRKGGMQIVDAMQKLREQGMRLHLTVVSSLTMDKFSQVTNEDKVRYENILASSDWITHYNSLPNAQVLELCKKAHVGLLPSMADTYGYAVLEMQACGCPVITTDIRALPEMNNDECGYLIRVPKQPSTEAKYDTPEDFAALKDIIYTELYRTISDILANPDTIKAKGEAAVAKIQRDHSPEKYAETLSKIYSRADQNGDIASS